MSASHGAGATAAGDGPARGGESLGARAAVVVRRASAWVRSRPHWLREAWGIVVLAAFAASIHGLHLARVDWFTSISMQLAHSARGVLWFPAKDSTSDAGKAEPIQAVSGRVTVIRFSPEGFAHTFCGLTPVPRRQTARVLGAVADAIGESGMRFDPSRLPVVGIDMDITSLSGPAASVEKACAIGYEASGSETGKDGEPELERAAGKLQGKAQLIALALGRADDPSRLARNQSMSALCSKGVRFAAGTAFLEPGKPFYWFAGEHAHGSSVNVVDEVPLPRMFPSLGNLMALAAEGSACEIEPNVKVPTCAEVITGACATVNAPSSNLSSQAFLLEDLSTSSKSDEKLAQVRAHYARRNLNLLSPVEVETIDNLDELKTAVTAALHEWERAHDATYAPMLLISIDDGITDRHFTVADDKGDTGGDQLQAMIAASRVQRLDNWSPWKSALLDIAVGAAFTLIWLSLSSRAVRLQRHGASFLAGTLFTLGPLAIATLVGVAVASISAWMLQRGQWVDPFLMLACLLLHAYLQAAHHTSEHAAHPAAVHPHPNIDPRNALHSTGPRTAPAWDAALRAGWFVLQCILVVWAIGVVSSVWGGSH